MHDLRQFSVCSRHQNRRQCRIQIIAPAHAVSDHILPIRLETEFSASLVLLIDPAQVYRVLIYRVYTVRGLLPIFRFRCEKSPVSDGRCPCVQRDPQTIPIFHDFINSAIIPLRVLLVPYKNTLHQVQNAVTFFRGNDQFLYRDPIHRLFRVLSRFCCHSPKVLLTFLHSAAVNRRVLHGADSSCGNRHLVPISSKDLLDLCF